MLKYILLLSLFVSATTYAQVDYKSFFLKMPNIKATTLTLINDKPTFNIKKWTVVKNKEVYKDLFGIENNKNTSSQTVNEVRILGCWAISEAQTAYIYAYDVLIDGTNKTTQVFLSTYHGIKGKTEDVNPFEKNPNPTGLRGKIVKTTTLNINEFGVLKLTTSHKNGNSKILKKESSFSVNEEGKMEMPE
jgi:hypothetical protein